MPDRRKLLQLAAAAAAAHWLPRSAWSQPRIAAPPFTLGVASGSPAADSVVLWTRLMGVAPGPVTVRWEMAHDEGFTRIARQGTAQALPELAHAVHVEAAGLEPDRWYFYRFMADAWTSPVGRTRTLPAPDAQVPRLRLAYASCQRWEHGWFSAWRHMRADAPDAVVFLGDYIYEYPRSARPVREVDGVWCSTLPQYRERYALYKSDPDLQAMHAACPWLFAWDDHEVQNDYAALAPGNAGPEVADFPARRAAAYQAYYEHMPLRSSVLTRALQGLEQGAELRLYGEQRFGRLAQLLLLDARQYKGAQVCNPEGRHGSSVLDPAGCAAWEDPARSMLGAAQEQWLDARLARGGATWAVLGQQTLFGQCNINPKAGRRLWNDGWDGYPAARQRLAAAVQEHAVSNLVLFGGDVHQNWVGHVKADYERPESATLGVEFCGTSITSRTGATDRTAEILAGNPHFVHGDASQRGYGLADFTPEGLEVALRVIDDPARRDAAIATQARFAVAAGRAELVRA